jgi:outer membrane protein assembly factor BamB
MRTLHLLWPPGAAIAYRGLAAFLVVLLATPGEAAEPLAAGDIVVTTGDNVIAVDRLGNQRLLASASECEHYARYDRPGRPNFTLHDDTVYVACGQWGLSHVNEKPYGQGRVIAVNALSGADRLVTRGALLAPSGQAVENKWRGIEYAGALSIGEDGDLYLVTRGNGQFPRQLIAVRLEDGAQSLLGVTSAEYAPAVRSDGRIFSADEYGNLLEFDRPSASDVPLSLSGGPARFSNPALAIGPGDQLLVLGGSSLYLVDPDAGEASELANGLPGLTRAPDCTGRGCFSWDRWLTVQGDSAFVSNGLVSVRIDLGSGAVTPWFTSSDGNEFPHVGVLSSGDVVEIQARSSRADKLRAIHVTDPATGDGESRWAGASLERAGTLSYQASGDLLLKSERGLVEFDAETGWATVRVSADLNAIEASPSGEIFGLDDNANPVLQLNAAGDAFERIISSQYFVRGGCVAVEPDGQVVAWNAETGELVRIDPTMGDIQVLSSGGWLSGVVGLVAHPSGDIYALADDHPVYSSGTYAHISGNRQRLVRIDPASGVQTPIDLPHHSVCPEGPSEARHFTDVLVASNGTLLLVGAAAGILSEVLRYDPTIDGTEILYQELGWNPPVECPFDFGSLFLPPFVGYWSAFEEAAGTLLVTTTQGDHGISSGLNRVDPVTGSVSLVVPAGYSELRELAVGPSGQFVTAGRSGMRRLDLASGTLDTVFPSWIENPTSLAWSTSGSLYGADSRRGVKLFDLDVPAATSIAPAGLSLEPRRLSATAGGELLVADGEAGLFSVDPTTGAQRSIFESGAAESVTDVAPENVSTALAGLQTAHDYFSFDLSRIDLTSGARTSLGGFVGTTPSLELDEDGVVMVLASTAYDEGYNVAMPAHLVRIDQVSGQETHISTGGLLGNYPRDLELVPGWSQQGSMAVGASLSLSATVADQLTCLSARAKALRKLSKQRSLDVRSCLADAAAGRGEADACLAAPGERFRRAQAKVSNVDTTSCEDCSPSFGWSEMRTLSEASLREHDGLLKDLLGADLELGVVSKALRPAEAKCQKRFVAAAYACATAHLSDFERCVKLGARKGVMNGGADLARCAAAAPAHKVLRFCIKKLGAAGACADTLGDVAPGCEGSNGAADCARRSVRCRVCRDVEDSHRLALDCDLVDDRERNASCG